MKESQPRHKARSRSQNRQPGQGRGWFPWALIALVALALGGAWWWSGRDTAQAGDVSTAQLAEGKALYEANCASCHGVDGEGQPTWRTPNDQGVYPAPPHDDADHTWHHPDQQLLDIIAQGGSLPKSGMPGYVDKLTRPQMEAILAYVKTFWGPEQREFQAEVTQKWRGQNQ